MPRIRIHKDNASRQKAYRHRHATSCRDAARKIQRQLEGLAQQVQDQIVLCIAPCPPHATSWRAAGRKIHGQLAALAQQIQDHINDADAQALHETTLQDVAAILESAN